MYRENDKEVSLLKVLLLSNTKGGVFTFSKELAKGLIEKRCTVHIFFLSKDGLVFSEIKELDSLYCKYSSISNLNNLKNLCNNYPEILHINFSSFGPFAKLTKRVFNIPYIYTIHGVPQPWLETTLKSKIAYTIEDMLLPYSALNASIVVSPSNYVKALLKKRFGVDSTVIYHGVNLNKFKLDNKTKNKNQLGYNRNALLILFVGKLHPYKDPLTLIRAISLALKDVTELHLAMIGSGELSGEVNKEITRLRLSKRVKIYDWVSEKKLRKFYNAADILVLPSVNEAFGIVLLEAMASGLPVIASNTGACPEILGSNETLFIQGDSEDLANKIVKLISNKKLLAKLRIEGRNRVEKQFGWSKSINKYFQIYESAVTDKF